MPSSGAAWRFVHFGVIVTGHGEHQFLDRFLRSLAASGRCSFTILERVGQLSPRTGPRHNLRVVGTQKVLTNRQQELGLRALGFVRPSTDRFVLVIDDLEQARRPIRSAVFDIYRAALDGVMQANAWRAGAFFLVNMLEAYYFADADAVNEVLGTTLSDYEGDVEDIGHPKNKLKSITANDFHEVRDGEEIVRKLDLPKVLSNPETCAGLRSLFAWCNRVLGDAPDDRFQLASGAMDPITSSQLVRLDERV